MDRDNLIETKENNKIKKFISCFSILVLFIGVFLVINNAGDTYAYVYDAGTDCPSGWEATSDTCKNEGFNTEDSCKAAINLTGVAYLDDINYCKKPLLSSTYTAIISKTSYHNAISKCYICEKSFDEYQYGIKEEIEIASSCSAGWKEYSKSTSASTCKSYYVEFYHENKLVGAKRYLGYKAETELIDYSTDGWTLLTWCKGSGGTNCVGGAGETMEVVSDTKLYASMEKIQEPEEPETPTEPETESHTYTAKFNANGGSNLSSTSKKCSTTGTSCSVEEPSVSRAGYTHVGWSTNPNSSSCSYNVTADASTPTYYACWSKNDYKVTFNMNGGILKRNDAITNKIVYKLGTINTSTYTAERNNDTFNGWSTSSDCSSPNKSYTNSNITKAMSLYACFTEVEDPKEPEPETPVATKYNVKFDTLGGKLLVKGTETTERTFKLSSLYYKDYVAQKEGYTFKGWSLSKSCDKIGSSEKYYDPLRENMDLYACYNANITISKIDIINDKALPDAEFELKNSAGKLIDKWITTEEPHEIKDLPNGKYKLTETKVPEGYEKTNEYMEFEITSEDGVRLEEIVIYNIPKNVVSISKQDITTKKELPGATLILKDSTGKEIDKWKSEDKPHVIKGLKAGKYTLEETIAPEGYKLNKERITFEVKSDGKVEPVVMYNTPKEEKNPQTGSALLFVVYIIGAISLGYACYYYVMNVKKND